MRYWLMKTEPNTYSIADLKRDKKTGWDGIRNYQARNFMRDQMTVGDHVLFYHSNAEPPGVAGLAKISQTGLADPSQFDSQSKYFDPTSDLQNPRWIMVQLTFVKTFKYFVSLPELRQEPDLSGMILLQKGSRLSVQPVDATHFDFICQLGQSQHRRPHD